MNRTEKASFPMGAGFLAIENEYRRLAQQLSDGPGQLLANAIFELRSAKRLMRVDMETADQGLDGLLDELQRRLKDLQQMVFELQPALLEEVGLEPVLERYAQMFRKNTGISLELQTSLGMRRLPATLEITLFRVIQECLHNIQKHADANHVAVRLENGADTLSLVVEDDGKGFTGRDNGLSNPRTGWLGMRNRVELLGGDFHVFNRASGGIRITLDIPYTMADDNLLEEKG